MRRIGLILLGFAVLFAVVAVWGLRTAGRAQAPAAPRANPGVAAIVVAAHPIAFGQSVAPADLKLQPWPADAVPAGAFRSIAQATSGPARKALGPIAADEVILQDRVTGPGGRASLARLLRPGMRAASVRVDDILGVGGFVLPGEQVDVLVTRNESAPAGGRGQARTDLLVQDVRVLAVDQQADTSKDRPMIAKAATLEVTPLQAQKLALASQVGVISLALRSADEGHDEAAAYQTVSTSTLGAAAAPRAAKLVIRHDRARSHAAPRGPTMEVYRGLDGSSVHVAAG